MTRLQGTQADMFGQLMGKGQLWQPAQLPSVQRSAVTPIGRGSLVRFYYAFHKPGHPAFPTVLISKMDASYMWGVNIQYLLDSEIKKLLKDLGGCGNTGFSYANFKGDEYIMKGFRQYKIAGIDRNFLRQIDCSLLVQIMDKYRRLDPQEIENIRQTVRQQINTLLNAPPEQVQEQPYTGV